jgi:adenine-specific DNA-methyltransferase
VEVSDYRYKEKRKNNPDAGLATYNFKEVKSVKYNYDPHLDPQLVWSGKTEHASFDVDTISLHIHERISTQAILKAVQKQEAWRQQHLFGEPELTMDKRIEFYQHEIDWANRLILGDSLLVMNSLLQRELMAGKVQMVYLDPPYGVNYKSNFQASIRKPDPTVQDRDENLTREPEQIKAYRDTWTLGIHSYLTYLRDRILLARELLSETGSIFVQISDTNIHHVKELLDETMGPANFVTMISFATSVPLGATYIPGVCDYLLWYAKDRERMKFRRLFGEKPVGGEGAYNYVELADGTRRSMTSPEKLDPSRLPRDSKPFFSLTMLAAGLTRSCVFEFEIDGKKYSPYAGRSWKTNPEGMKRLAKAGRLMPTSTTIRYVLYHDDYPVAELTNMWTDTGGASDKVYVVQTSTKVVERCMLMTTDPGDLVVDPTCGSGTTAYVAETWGRRWITCDTSRVAIALARQRLLTATYKYHKLANPEQGVNGGFVYETVPHITVKSIAQNPRIDEVPDNAANRRNAIGQLIKQSAESETLYDKAVVDSTKVRVSGPFTVEAIPIASSSVSPAESRPDRENESAPAKDEQKLEASDYVTTLVQLLQKNGVTFAGGKKLEIPDLRPTLSSGMIHAEGTAKKNGGEGKVAVSIGPRYGPISTKQVDEALRLSYRMGFDILIFAGFAFDPESRVIIEKNPMPNIDVQFANMSPDILVGDLLKTTKSSQLFTVFGEPDVKIERKGEDYGVKLLGVDTYDPVTGEVQKSDGSEIPAWFLDEDYDGLTFRMTQAFFPMVATKQNPWDKLENALHGIVDSDKLETFRGLESLSFKPGKEKKVAVKVLDARGNEVMLVRDLVE